MSATARWTAVAAIVATLALVWSLAIAIWPDIPSRLNSFASDRTREQIPAEELRIGDCLRGGHAEQFPSELSINSYGWWVVSCDEPHEYEVVAVRMPPSDLIAKYTDELNLTLWYELCLPAAEEYAGAEQEYHVNNLHIRPEAWRHGRRTIVCVIRPIGVSQYVGSLRKLDPPE